MSHPDTQPPVDSATSGRAASEMPPGTGPDALPGVAPQTTAEWPSARLAAIDEDAVRLLVHTFYGRIRDDDMLGPVFREALEGWGAARNLLGGAMAAWRMPMTPPRR